ncbi:hypothetical protein [Burkholderia pyrrocinia]|uniref:Uncharacterized protein n=1 Tax=Burkholderia pyrrocinia TaxID=60550 RepID=A0ABZ3BVQ9_BURPY
MFRVVAGRRDVSDRAPFNRTSRNQSCPPLPYPGCGCSRKAGADPRHGVFRDYPERLRRQGRPVCQPRGRNCRFQSIVWHHDSIARLVNAALLAGMIRQARLPVVDGGHPCIVNRACDVASMAKPCLVDDDSPRDAASMRPESGPGPGS